MEKKYALMYDVHSDHERIIHDLTMKNWHSIIKGVTDSNVEAICYFPETTWWKEFTDSRDAFEEFRMIAGKANVIRVFICSFDEWRCTISSPMEHQKEEAKHYM